MNTPNRLAAILTLLLISGGLVISACTSAASAQPKSDLEARVSTAAAATLVQYMVETEVAAQSVLLAAEPALQATQTPLPSPTPVPTETAPPTAAPTATQPTPTSPPALASASGPIITADQNTNCRTGPGTGYRVVSYFMQGAQSTVEGQDAGKDWWYIPDPQNASSNCWVWEGSTTVAGDTSAVPVVAAPTAPKTNNSQWYCSTACFYPNTWCGDSVYNCGFYPCNYKNCWQTSSWWGCYCTEWTCASGWKNTWKTPWKEPSCPPVTQVNYKKYCKNYPQCCD